MQGSGALNVIELLQKTGSKTRPVILAGRMSHEEFMHAMQLGVRGVFSTALPAPLLARCVRVVQAGEEFIDREVWRRTFDVWPDAQLGVVPIFRGYSLRGSTPSRGLR